jgi:hypothetical protein
MNEQREFHAAVLESVIGLPGAASKRALRFWLDGPLRRPGAMQGGVDRYILVYHNTEYLQGFRLILNTKDSS